MQTFLIIVQIILSLLITVLIFLQAPADDGRSNLMSTVNFEKRGWEKVMFNFTIFVLIAFIVSSLIQVTL